MARPQKEGMDYFPHDTDATNDEKLEALRAMFGNDGYAFYFILLERIYRSNNAELSVKKPIIMVSIVSKLGITQELFNSIMEAALDLELFDYEAYKKSQIITSRGIKKRFDDVEKMRERWRRKKASNTDVFPIENPVDNKGENNEDNPVVMGQRKVKKSKVNTYTDDCIYLWSLYPEKIDKAAAMKKLPALIKQYDKDQIERTIKRYIKSVEQRRVEGFPDLKFKNGSTFFNGSYVDYLDENYEDKPAEKVGGVNKAGIVISDNSIEERRDKIRQFRIQKGLSPEVNA